MTRSGARWPWLAVAALVGLLLASFLPVDPLSQDLTARFSGPSREHPLGTDQLGRDLLARLLVGARLSLGLTAVLVALTAVIGTVVGTVAARRAGLLGFVVDRTVEVLVAIPALVFGLMLAAALGPGVVALSAAVLLAGWTPYARIARNLTQAVQSAGWVAASVALGAKRRHVVRRAILPNIVRPLITLTFLRFADVLLVLAGLSFLGLGAQPPVPEWGAMIAEGRLHLARAPALLLLPSAAVVLVAVASASVGRAMERRWEIDRVPRQRTVVHRRLSTGEAPS